MHPAPSPSCGDDDDSSGCVPHPISFVQRQRQQLRPCAPPCLLCAAAAATAQPHALPCPISFVQQWRRQLSHVPCPTPSPLCSGGDDSSGRAPHPVSFVWRRRRQLRMHALPHLLRAVMSSPPPWATRSSSGFASPLRSSWPTSR